MMHIWLHQMQKTEQELKKQKSSHVFLIGAVGGLIGRDDRVAHGSFRSKIWTLKALRTNADYSNTLFDDKSSANALSLSADIIPILKKYVLP
jgi:hypothetical protein